MNYFLSFWVFSNIIIFLTGFFLQKKNTDMNILNQISYSVFISRGAGLCLSVLPALILIPMCKHTVTFIHRYTKLRILPQYSLFFHKICAWTILFWSIVHTVCHYINLYSAFNLLKLNTLENLHYIVFGGITGHLMIISLYFIYFLAKKEITSTSYRKLFWYFHHFFILFFVAFIYHSFGCFVKDDNGKCFPYHSYKIVSAFLGIYIMERLYREFSPIIPISSYSFSGNNDICQITLSFKVKNYSPGQYVLLRCLDINLFEWHAFSITQYNREECKIQLSIKCIGDWTEKFKELLKSGNCKIQIDGPFCSTIESVFDYREVILIASGIGITPFIEILRNIPYHSSVTRKIKLIWISKYIEDFSIFNDVLKSEMISLNTLEIFPYVTEKFTDINSVKAITSEKMNFLLYVKDTNIPVYYGRPDFNYIFKDYSSRNFNSKIGVFVCSSENISESVRKSCENYSTKKTEFIFNYENF